MVREFGMVDRYHPKYEPKPELPSPEQLKKFEEQKRAELLQKAKESFERIKKKAEAFKRDAVAKYKKEILGMVLLPPKKEGLDMLVLLQLEGTPPEKFNKKKNIQDKLSEIAKKRIPEVKISTALLDEIWDMCFKGKYEILGLIAAGLPVYDTGWIGALRLVEIHKMMVLKKFEKYVVCYVLAGSMVRGDATPESDVDTFLVIDDTDVTRMTAAELKAKLRAIIWGMGAEAGDAAGVRNKLNTQVYILTEMWDSIKSANPVIFTFLRDGIPLYDRGMFMPWKLLLKQGKITPTPEAVDMYLKSGKQILDRTKFKLREIAVEDFFWATFTPSQGVLMLVGVPPPDPKATPGQIREHFVKPGLLEEKYVKTLEQILKVRKDIETGRLKEVQAKLVDELMGKAEDYLKRLDKLVKQIEVKEVKKDITELYEKMIEDVLAALKMVGVKATPSNAIKLFEQHIVKKKLSPSRYLKILKRIAQLHEEGKGERKEIASLAFEQDRLARDTFELIRAEKGKRVEKYKISAVYSDKRADIWLLEDTAFIVVDVSRPDTEIKKFKITKDGAFVDEEKSSLKELNDAVAKFAGTLTKITRKTIESLKKILGEDVQLVVGT